MNEIKVFTNGGLNYDTELHLLPKDDWVDAINVRMAASDEQQEGAATNIEGNVRIGNYNYAAGTNICIGAFADEFRNVIIACIWNSNGNDEIIEINPDSGTITPILKNLVWTGAVDVLQFDPWVKIPSIGIIHRSEDEGDLLFWTAENIAPRKINIKKSKAFGTPDGYPNPILLEYTLLAKEPPNAPTAAYFNDLDRDVNNVRGKLFQCQVRYVYDDYEKSTWSGWSDFHIPELPFVPDRDSDPTINTGINYTFGTGNTLVRKIEVGIRQNTESTWGDCFLVATLDKVKDGIGDNTTYTFAFYNDNAGVAQLPAEVNQVWDLVPKKAACMAIINGDTLAFGDIVEGMNFDGDLDVRMTVSMTNPPLGNGSCILSWKYNGKYRFGIVYFDELKRTDGVQTRILPDDVDNDFEVDIESYSTTETADDVYFVYVPHVNAEIYHEPPIWAKTFRWVRTNYLTASKFLQYTVFIVSDSDFAYFNLDLLTEAISVQGQNALGYDFVPGDRCRIIRKMVAGGTPGFMLNTDTEVLGVVKDPVINGITYSGNLVKMTRNTAMQAMVEAAYLIELYSPSKISNNDFFYEFDKEYLILNPGESNRAHQGGIQDQNGTSPAMFVFQEGDVYLKRRRKMLVVYPPEQRYTIEDLQVQDPNYSDVYGSAVNGNGRGFIIDENEKEQRLPTTIRYGGAYIQGSFINKTNNFPAANIVDNCDRSFGSIKRLTVRDRQLRVYQELKCGWLPIQQSVLQTANGNTLVSQSDQLLNNIQYYEGDFGIGNAPCSLTSKNFADYFHDTNRGVICRLSRDGLTPISITEKMNRFAIVEDVKYKATVYTGNYPPDASDIPGRAQIYGVFDSKNNEYISVYQGIAGYTEEGDRFVISGPKTMVWDEVRNRFVSPYSYVPEWLSALKNDVISFKNGIPYIHNDKVNRCRFYGEDHDWSLTLVFNDKFAVKKSFQGIDVLSNIVLQCPVIETSLSEFGAPKQLSNLIESDFEQLEEHYHAVFLRDENSPGGIINGDILKGSYLKVTLKKTAAQEQISLHSVNVSYLISQLNTK